MEHLCISVTFLDPLFHGRADGSPEWPPSPMRLFQALLAGAHTGVRGRVWSNQREDAFRWLERQAPPRIVTPTTAIASRVTYFVPNNQSDAHLERQTRLTAKVVQPHRMNDGDTVHYVWKIEPDDRSCAEAICRESRGILALGWGIDQVIGEGRIVDQRGVAALAGRTWVPTRTYRSADRLWRVPIEGSLENLEEVYASFVERTSTPTYRPPEAPHRFATVHYQANGSLPPRPYAIFELPEGVDFHPGQTAAVAGMLRSLAYERAQLDEHAFPGFSDRYVAGHVEKTDGARFSYLALPTIGHRHADGRIRRLLVAEPLGGEGTHARWAQQWLRTRPLLDEDGDNRGQLLDLWRPASREVIKQYVGESRAWTTVTPIILPGFDDGRQEKAEGLVLKAARHAGMPIEAIDDLTLRKAPFWPGALHPRSYMAPEYIRHYSRWHALIRFRQPVGGPLALGAGRHVGLGLFAISEGLANPDSNVLSVARSRA